MLEIQTINARAEWGGIAADWSALVDCCGATPFQRPEWLLPWWDHFGSGEMLVLAFRNSGRLVGHAPLFIHPWQGRRQVTFIGNGITDYLGLAALPKFASDCAAKVFDTIADAQDQWDVCDWQDLDSDSPLLKIDRESLEASRMPHTDCRYLELAGDPDEFDAALPHGLRRTLRRCTHRFWQEGDLHFQTTKTADESLIETLFDLHQRRWEADGGPQSMLESKHAQSFVTSALQNFSERGRVRLYSAHWQDRVIAMICGIRDGDRLYGYLTGFDPSLSRNSPGSLLLNYAIRSAMDEGAKVWDFLRGDEPYKMVWGAKARPKSRLLLWHDGQHAPKRPGSDLETSLVAG